MKNNKGITLIALVITIIVLLILAGVSIALLTGENGILNQAQQAKTTNAIAEEKEKIKLGYMDYKMLKEREIEGRTLTVDGATEVTGDETNGWTIKFGDNLYTLSADGSTIEGPTTAPQVVPIISTTINGNATRDVNEGEDITLTLDINPANATEIPVWTSDDTRCATVTASADGKSATVHGVLDGVVYISATNSTNTIKVYVKSTCCFDAGSQVLMADGTTKNIEEVKENDMVMSLNEDTGEFVSQKVKNTLIRHNSDDLVYVNLSNGQTIGMRAYHPLLTTEGYKSLRPELAQTTMEVGESVDLLEVGDTLVGYGENVTITSIEQRPEIENYDTYNLCIEGYHNYIVNGVVVHNVPEIC